MPRTSSERDWRCMGLVDTPSDLTRRMDDGLSGERKLLLGLPPKVNSGLS